ncbi:uncharacterized protein LOC131240592 [Magnolia sinica]|uniref:uncharacterized protein LOC131240592 n=1 Tax=Magnolia sinica TaxID=86752 RepID=UPI0026590DBA|nr:uncharacterized protein LOC131240592 [Magnolia sinica]
MGSTGSPLLQALSLPRSHRTRPTACAAYASKSEPKVHYPAVLHGRRQCLFLLTALTATRTLPSLAEDIPLFGLRKKLRKAEEEAEEILREGERAVEKGIEVAEKGIVTVEKEIVTVESEIGTVGSFAVAGDLVQAGVVAAAEVLGVVIASSVVNGILGPEAQKY